MENKYKIRIYRAHMSTKYGTDVAHLFDDPVDPNYTYEEVIEKLKDELDYVDFDEDQENGEGHTGLYDGDILAYFDYDCFKEIEIPDSIVQRIVKESK